MLAADWIAHAIKERADGEALAIELPRDLVRETASRIADDSEAIDMLRNLLTIGVWRVQPMAASLLHALGFGWKPDRPVPRLAGAYLDQASWPNIDLGCSELYNADLSGSNLRGSRLDSANLSGANLSDVDLSTASMDSAKFERADLSRAVLWNVRAVDAALVQPALLPPI